MLVYRFALGIFFSAPFLATSSLGQIAPAQPPIACEIKANVEDITCQKKLKDLITREGDTLIVRLDGGKSKTFVGNRAACDGKNADVSRCKAFNVLSYFPQIQFYLIGEYDYECGQYLFVSRHTGSATTMSAIPMMSPNEKYLLSIDQNDACGRQYDIAIWSVQADPPKLEFKYHAKQYENWSVVTWEDDTHIKLKAWIGGNTSYDQEAELVRAASGWSLQLGERVGHPRQSISPPGSGVPPRPPAANSTAVQQHEPLPKCSLTAGIPGITCSN